MEPIKANTLGEAMFSAAKNRHDSVFFIEHDRTLSYGCLQATSRRLAGALLGLGIQPGDRVGLLGLNTTEWIQLFFAVVQIGGVVVGMSPRYRDSEIEYIVNDSGTKFVFALEQHEGHSFTDMFERLAPRLPSLQRVFPLDEVTLLALSAHAVDDATIAEVTDNVNENQLAMVIYTSGTTGRPKGAGLTHHSMLSSARAQATHMRMCEQDILQLASPLNHVGGITCGVLSMMLGGGVIDLVAEFKASAVLNRMRLHSPTLVGGVPTMMQLLLVNPDQASVDLNRVRLIFVGGSNVDAELLHRLKERMPQATLMNLYGLSETSGAIVMTPWNCSPDDLTAAIGNPIVNAEVQVVDSDGSPLPSGSVGELCFRGAGVIHGYVGAAEQSSAFSHGDWLRTGDLGFIDGRGLISLKGRAKDMYIQGGFNVYPAEIEAFIARHPEVLMVAGIGVSDPILGEIGRYYVIRKAGSELEATDIKAWCAQGLADYKIPRQIVFCDALPLTPAGKIHKAALRDAVRAEDIGHSARNGVVA